MGVAVFTSGEDGYHSYRIPSLLVTPSEALLAICEGRRNNRRDHGDIDLLVKRSVNGGASWSSQKVIYGEEGEVTIGNPCPVSDRQTGAVWLAFCRENADVLMTCSRDGGVSWEEPSDITADVKKPEWGWYATGPGNGIRLERSDHGGRLVIPCDHRSDGSYGNGSHTIYSDDLGYTWKLSEVIQPGANECQVAELTDGTLLMSIRMQTSSEGYRGIAYSSDGGVTWQDFQHDRNLPCPKCQASLVTVGEDKLLFSNPDPGSANPEKGERARMTVRLSTDGGRSWPNSKVLHEGPAAYSSLAHLPDGSYGCLYEAGDDNPYEHLVFDSFTL